MNSAAWHNSKSVQIIRKAKWEETSGYIWRTNMTRTRRWANDAVGNDGDDHASDREAHSAENESIEGLQNAFHYMLPSPSFLWQVTAIINLTCSTVQPWWLLPSCEVSSFLHLPSLPPSNYSSFLCVCKASQPAFCVWVSMLFGNETRKWSLFMIHSQQRDFSFS